VTVNLVSIKMAPVGAFLLFIFHKIKKYHNPLKRISANDIPSKFHEKILTYKNKHKLSIRKIAKYFELGVNSIARWEKKP
jgi:hypothetical protein